MGLIKLFLLMINFVLILGKVEVDPHPRGDEHAHLDVYSSAISKAHYNPWFCNYFRTPGYRCVSCRTAMHCYPGNFALLVQCAGKNPYCYNGYCAEKEEEGCTESEEGIHHSLLTRSTLPPYVAGNVTRHKNDIDGTIEIEAIASSGLNAGDESQAVHERKASA